MEVYIQYSFKNISFYAKVLSFVLVLFSWNGVSQNLLTNPGLNVAAVDCTGNFPQANTSPDSWSQLSTPDRSTEVTRAFHSQFESRTASPSGGCYFGFRSLGAGVFEGIEQPVTVVGGETYTFSFYYMIETRPGATTCVPVLEFRLDGNLIQTFPPPPAENVWIRPPGTFVAPVSGTFTFTFVAGGGCRETWNFVDDLDLRLACTATGIILTNQSACNDNGTTGTETDDFFTADVIVTYFNPPPGGTLDLTGDGTASVAVGSLDSTTSHTFVGVQFPADGGAIDLTATFSGDPACSFNEPNAGVAPGPCSVPPCDVSDITTTNLSACNDNGAGANPNDDFFTADVSVIFTNPPPTGTLDLTGDGTASVAVGSLDTATTHTFLGVQMPADGGLITLTAGFSNDAPCTSTKFAGTAPVSCSVPSADLQTVKILTSGNPIPAEADIVTFTITVTNNGPDTATNISLDDIIPIGLTPTGNNGNVSSGSYTSPSWTIPNLTNGASATLTIEGTVNVGQDGNTITNITSAAEGDQNDPTTAGDDLTESVTIVGCLDTDGDGTCDSIDPDPNDPCVDDGTIGDEDTSNPIWQVADCDGDGETNGTEATNGTDPFDPCSVTNPTVQVDPMNPGSSEQAAYDIWAAADCDGDGVTNGQEVIDATDPFNPCDYSPVLVTLPQTTMWLLADCDGDGTSNGQEVIDGTDPMDPCSVTNQTVQIDPMNPGSPEQAAYDIWAAADCDGDGETNGEEVTNGTDPQDPCSLTVATIPDPTDPNYAIWAAADCDGDGETNGTEVTNGTDPFDPCSVTIATIPDPADPNYGVWAAADCDGDGETNGTEATNGTDPVDPCSVTNPTVQVDPMNPGSSEQAAYDVWAAADCDGDGVTNGQEVIDATDPNDPCDYLAASQDISIVTPEWEALDCDGDGVTNGDEITDGTDPQDPCNYMTGSVRTDKRY